MNAILFNLKCFLEFRGHDESADSPSRGNFLSFLDFLVKKGVIPCSGRLQSKVAKYTSPDSQNELLQIAADKVLEQIAAEVATVGYCSVLADETKDISKKEQMSICLRYVHDGAVVERFVGFAIAKKLDAESLAHLIVEKLKALGVAEDKLVAQCYDGAAAMSGHKSGVQQRLRNEFPRAVYIHCHNHCLQLAVSDTCSTVPEAAEFFDLLKAIYDFIVNSNTRHELFINAQGHDGGKVYSLPKYSETRWSCEIRCITAFRRTYAAIVETLEIVADDTLTDSVTRAQAAGFSLQVRRWRFASSLVLFKKIFGIVSVLSDVLQKDDLDIAKAVGYVSKTEILPVLGTRIVISLFITRYFV